MGHTYEFRFKPVHKWTPRCRVQEGRTCGSGMKGRGPCGGARENITTEVEVMPGKDGGSEHLRTLLVASDSNST